MSINELKAAIARVEILQEGSYVGYGTGFLVTERHLLTAMHVVADRKSEGLALLGDVIQIFFEGLAPLLAKPVEGRWDRQADWILLECPEPPNVAPLRMGRLLELGDWKTYGFPVINPGGMVFDGRVCDLHTPGGTYQLFSDHAAAGGGAPVYGLSGAPCIIKDMAVGLLRTALIEPITSATLAGTLYACPMGDIFPRIADLLASSLFVVGKPPLPTPRTLRLEGIDGEVHLALHIKEHRLSPPVPVSFPARLGATEGALRARFREIQPQRATKGPGEIGDAIHAMGTCLGQALWGQGSAVGRLMVEELAEAIRQGEMLPLGLEAPSHWLNLFWETAPAPDGGGMPLGLHPYILFYRRPPRANPYTVSPIPGPLRVLVVMGSPDDQSRTGELLDLEREVAIILDALADAMRDGKAFVEVLEEGSLEAIREALSHRRFHVLHLTCHAAPGRLILEKGDGEKDEVSPHKLVDAIPAGQGVPLVFLSGCSTGYSVVEQEAGASPMPGFAEQLNQRGVPYVVAMQAPVSDPYATDLAARFYRHLATGSIPEPCRALWEARRGLENERAERVRALEDDRNPVEDMAYAPGAACSGLVSNLPEWPVPVIYVGDKPGPLFEHQGEFETIKPVPQAAFIPGVAYRTVRSFVGRRRERRELLRLLRTSHRGVMIHGIGGVGKSTLAAHLVERLVASEGMIVVSLVGRVGVDKVLQAVGQHFTIGGMKAKIQGKEEQSKAMLAMGQMIIADQISLPHRLAFFESEILPQAPLLLLMDNFEDNLVGVPQHRERGEDSRSQEHLSSSELSPSKGSKGESRERVQGRGGQESKSLVPFLIGDQDLAQALGRWLTSPTGKMRIILTCRYPFALPGRALKARHLGPLTLAEGRKLMLRLEGLMALTDKERHRILAEIGGHPRSLEYLDALLRYGEALYTDIEDRLRQALWWRGVSIDDLAYDDKGHLPLDSALAETVTLAAEDVLLQDLLVLLPHGSMERRLLFGASVMRHPMSLSALRSQAVEVDELDLPEEAYRAWEKAQAGQYHTDTATLWRQFVHQIDVRPEVRRALDAAAERLCQLSLLVQESFNGENLYYVHRWTAQALERHLAAQELTELHRRAAVSWEIVMLKGAEDIHRDVMKPQHVDMLLEIKWHYLHAGDIEGAWKALQVACSRLEMSGDYNKEESLWVEASSWFDEKSQEKAVIYHQFGMISQIRGDWDKAEKWYLKSLEIKELLQWSQGIAISYHHLGMIAQFRGHWDRATDLFLKSIDEDPEDRGGVSGSYHQLGIVARAQGNLDAAEKWHTESLKIREQIGRHRQGIAHSYHQLGILAYERGDLSKAEELYRKSLEIKKEIGDSLGISTSCYQLGRLSQDRGEWDKAEEWYRESLRINKQLWNRPGIALSHSQLGVLRLQQNRLEEALRLLMQSLSLRLELRSPDVGIDLHYLAQIRHRLGNTRFEALVQDITGSPWPENLSLLEVKEGD